MKPPDEPQQFSWRRWVTSLLLVRRTHAPAVTLIVWAALAVSSVSVATFVGLRPESLQDLWTVREWLQHWVHRGDPYSYFERLDYPPTAFFVLWPLYLPDTDSVVLWLIPSMVVSLGVGAVILVRWFAGRLGVRLVWYEQAVYVLMLLAGSPLRGTIWRGQTTPLAFLFGALALHWSRQRPVLAALALALCAFKPHIAIGFGLILLLIERRAVVYGAVAMVIASSLLFAATVDRSLFEVLVSYAHNLTGLYDGPERLRGLLSIRWMLDDIFGGYLLGTYAYITFGVGTLGLIVSAARRSQSGVTVAQVSAACLLWSLLFLPQQLYNGVLAAPALWLLMWPESKLLAGATMRLTLVGGYLLFGLLDVQRLARLSADAIGDEDLAMSAYYLAPTRLTILFGVVLYGLWRTRTPDAVTPAATTGSA